MSVDRKDGNRLNNTLPNLRLMRHILNDMRKGDPSKVLAHGQRYYFKRIQQDYIKYKYGVKELSQELLDLGYAEKDNRDNTQYSVKAAVKKGPDVQGCSGVPERRSRTPSRRGSTTKTRTRWSSSIFMMNLQPVRILIKYNTYYLLTIYHTCEDKPLLKYLYYCTVLIFYYLYF